MFDAILHSGLCPQHDVCESEGIMSATAAVTVQTTGKTTDQQQEPFVNGNPGHWPRDILEAYARDRGPYTVENAETILEEEPVELYNGWLVWQEMTNPKERRIVANLQSMLDIPARKA